jgi:acyl carrier protein
MTGAFERGGRIMADITERVRKVVIEHLDQDPTKVTPEADFQDLGADSLDEVELIMALEEEFDVEIPDADADTVKTVGDAIALITSKVEG